MAVDFARGYIYLEGNGGMHRIRTRDMQEDLHVTAARRGAAISPKLVDSNGNIYSTSLETVRKFSGSNYRLLVTAEDRARLSSTSCGATRRSAGATTSCW